VLTKVGFLDQEVRAQNNVINNLSRFRESIPSQIVSNMFSDPYVTSRRPFMVSEQQEFCGLCQAFHPPMAHIISEAMVPV
jgi:hypothetical protein